MKKGQRGFTLLELIIYVAILAFVLILVSETIIVTLHSRDHIKARTEVQQNLRFATEKISLTCRKATGVTLPAANSSGEALVLTMAGDNIVFSVSDGILQMTEGADPAQNLTTGKVQVTSVAFHQVNNTGSNPTVQVNITVEYKSGGNPHLVAESSGQTTIALR